MRLRAAACLTVLVATTLSGCGTSSYCTAVEANRAAIDDATLTTASFTSLGEALRAIEIPGGVLRAGELGGGKGDGHGGSSGAAGPAERRNCKFSRSAPARECRVPRSPQ